MNLYFFKERNAKFYLSQIEDYNPGTASQKALRTVPPLEVKVQSYKFFETEGCTLNNVLLTVYTPQI